MTSISEFRRILVDTSAWIALMNRKDRLHERAAAFHREYGTSVRRVTTWGIVSETYTWLRYHIGHEAGQHWLQTQASLQSTGFLEVIYPTPDLDSGVRAILSRYADQDLSYVDAFSIHVIRSNKDLDAAFAFDHHFALAGVPVIPGGGQEKVK